MASSSVIGDRLVVGAEEARHLRRVLDQVIGGVRHLHLHQHVAREELALGRHLAPAPHLDDLLGRHQHLLEQVRQARGLGPLLDRPRPPSSRSSSRRARCTSACSLSSARLSPLAPAPPHGCALRASLQFWPLPSQPEHELHQVADDHVGEQEEHRSQRHHDQHHGRRDPDLFPGRPRDLRCLLAHLFDEVKRVLHRSPSAHDPREPRDRAAQPCHSGYVLVAAIVLRGVASIRNKSKPIVGRGGGSRTPNLRFWRPTLYQLSYTP